MPFLEFRRSLARFPGYVYKNRKCIRLLAESITFCVVTGGLGWLAYEVRETVLAIERCVQKDPMLLNYKAPEYVFVNKAAFTELDEYQIIDNNSIIQPANPPIFFLQKWNDFKHKKAWKLLEMANKCKNSKLGLAATQRLTTMVHLKDSDFQHFAQMSEAHTLIGLARSANVNPKFFLPPRNMSWTKDVIINKVHDLLIKLNMLSEHKCLSYFVAHAFKDKHLDYYHPEDKPPDFRSMHIDNDNILQLSISALRHHCNNQENVTALVKLGGLQVLMALYQHLKHDEEVAEEIGKLLSVASLNKDLVQDIFSTGWVSVLFEWKNHHNFKIQSWANRTLLNMDDEDPVNGNYMFGKQTVLLYPKNRCHQVAKIDIVLVHGLLGGVSFSWREKDLLINEPLGLFDMSNKVESPHINSNTPAPKIPVGEDMQDYLESYKEVKAREWDLIGSEFEFVLNDIPLKENAKGHGPYSVNGGNSTVRQTALNEGYSQCWPSDWLPTDEEGLRVIGVDYSTTLSEWLPSCPLKSKNHRTLEGRTEKLMNQLLAIGIGDRPIIFLAHSMGGLLVKNILVSARNSTDPNVRKLFEKTRSVFFFSTPHHGSSLATLNSAYRFFLWPSVEVDELRTDSPKLVSLHDNFLKCLEENPMKIVTFAESIPTEFTALKVPILCVPKDAADPSVGELYELPLNHMSICKADSKLSFVYQKTLSVIKTVAAYSS